MSFYSTKMLFTCGKNCFPLFPSCVRPQWFKMYATNKSHYFKKIQHSWPWIYYFIHSTKFTRPKNKLLLNLSRDGVNNISSYFPYILLHLSRTQTRSRVKTFSYKWISIGLVFTKENAFFICAVHKICKNKCGGMKETSQEIQPFCAGTI